MMRPNNLDRSGGVKVLSLYGMVQLVMFLALPALATVSIPLAWTPGVDPNITGYKIYYGLASGVYTNSVDVGNVTNATITGLSGNTTYYFAATAYNADGTLSDFSNESTVDVMTPPTMNALGSLSINENAGLQTVNLTGLGLGTGQTLSLTAVSSNPALIPDPAVNYTSPAATGTLSFTPAINAYGSATITVTGNNGQARSNLVTQTFTVSVAPVYQPPTLNALGNLSINENAGLQTVNLTGLSLGTGQALNITAVSSNPGLIPIPAVNYTSPAAVGTLSFSPATNSSGTATITVTANNGLSQSNLITRTFTVNVAAVNQPPTLNPIGNLTLNFNSAAQIVDLTGISSGGPDQVQTLAITATSSNLKVVASPTVSYTSPKTGGTLTIQPIANTNGISTITVTVNNGGKSNNIITRSFTVTILAQVIKPVVLNPLTNCYVLVSNSATFSVQAAGLAPLSYQWIHNSTNVPGATGSILTLNNVTASQAGKYYVTVSNSAGNTNSSVAALVVVSTPAATLSATAGATGGFSFAVNGVSGYQYAVQTSSDLVHWTSVQTNAAPFSFVDSTTNQFSQHFYRTVSLP